MLGIEFLRERKVTRRNRSFEGLFGYAPGELDGKSSRQRYGSDKDWAAAGERFAPHFAAGLTFECEVLLYKKDATPVVCDTRSKAINANDLSEGVISIALDITARKDAESLLCRAREQLKLQLNERVQQLAHFDSLTGLPNRVQMHERGVRMACAVRSAKQARIGWQGLKTNLKRT